MSSDVDLSEEVDQFRADFETLRAEISEVIVGQQRVINDLLIAMLAGGHVLLEGVPGLGKTLLGRTLAESLDLTFRRIQFTPDLMPADVVGTYVVMEAHGQRKFEFNQGPIFANVVLADQINRATPKTQAALLEGMSENGVTVANETYPLPDPFFLVATQNPLEMEGTFPLPEAQLDRFMFKLMVPLPNLGEMEAILARTTEEGLPEVRRVLKGRRILEMADLARLVPTGSEVLHYASALMIATHPDQSSAPEMTRQYVRYGVGPRAAQSLVLASKVRALLSGRVNTSQDDVRSVAHAALRHRLILNFDGHADNINPDAIIDDILGSVGE
jgi:MoxR-like ATPase